MQWGSTREYIGGYATCESDWSFYRTKRARGYAKIIQISAVDCGKTFKLKRNFRSDNLLAKNS